MITKDVHQFLSELKRNNDKEWFTKNKNWYQSALTEITELAQLTMETMKEAGIEIEELPPKKCIFRIYRDVRFSKNKEPYKTNFGIAIPHKGMAKGTGGYYIHIMPGNNFIAGGYWMPAPEDLRKIRQEIDYQDNNFLNIVKNKSFISLFGELSQEAKLKLPPKGYDKEHPMIEWLKLKSFVAVRKIDDAAFYKKNILTTFVDTFKEIEKLNKFIYHALR